MTYCTLRVTCYPDRRACVTRWHLIGFVGTEWIDEIHDDHDSAQRRAVELSGLTAPVLNHC